MMGDRLWDTFSINVNCRIFIIASELNSFKGFCYALV